jgi:hypothetical protein
VQLARKLHSEAIASRKAETAILDQLLKLDPGNAEYQMRRSWPDVGLAQILIEMGRPAEAADILERRWAIFRPRMTADKSNQYWESGLRIVLFLAKARRASGSADHRQLEQSGRELIRRYLELFPERGEQIRSLIKNIG